MEDDWLAFIPFSHCSLRHCETRPELSNITNGTPGSEPRGQLCLGVNHDIEIEDDVVNWPTPMKRTLKRKGITSPNVKRTYKQHHKMRPAWI